MGKLSRNNIGEVIKRPSDDEFALRLETDRECLVFYGLPEQAKYREAEEKDCARSHAPQDKFPLFRLPEWKGMVQIQRRKISYQIYVNSLLLFLSKWYTMDSATNRFDYEPQNRILGKLIER